MSINKGRNRFFILKTILLTLALIGCFTVAFISIMFLFINGVDILKVLGAISGIFLGTIAVKTLIKLNKGWMTKIITEINNGKIASSMVWKFPPEEWSNFITWRKTSDKNDLKGSIIVSSIIAIIIFFAMAYSNFDLAPLIGLSLVGGTMFGSLIGMLMYWGTVIQTKKMASQPNGRITFTENAILINDLLIFFNQIGTSLKKIKIVQHEPWLLLHVIVLTQAGTRKNEKKYIFPIPSDKVQEAKKLVELYGFSSDFEINVED